MNNLKKYLSNHNIFYLENEPLSAHTSFGIGGPCKFMVLPKNYNEIIDLIYILNKRQIQYEVIGNGTNILADDNGYNGVIIKLAGNFSEINIKDNSVICQSGVGLFKLNKYLAKNNLSGLEFSYGIPGTVGGATFMNAGAFGNCVGNFIEEVSVLKDGVLTNINKDNLKFEYRKSNIDGLIITTKFKLSHSENVNKECENYFQKRILTQPYGEKSAGSIFKRQEGFIVSKEVDNLGLKGYNINGAEISCKHAGFIINKGGAKCKDVLDLINVIKNKVYDYHGIILELEIKIL